MPVLQGRVLAHVSDKINGIRNVKDASYAIAAIASTPTDKYSTARDYRGVFGSRYFSVSSLFNIDGSCGAAAEP